MSATATAIVSKPSRPETRGRVLSRLVTVAVHDGTKETEYTEKRVFITRARVQFPPSAESMSGTVGPFVGVWIEAPDFQRTYCMVPGELRHVAARLVPNRFYGFEGTAQYARRDNQLTRFLIVTGITNQTITVSDRSLSGGESVEEVEEEPLIID